MISKLNVIRCELLGRIRLIEHLAQRGLKGGESGGNPAADDL